MADDAALSRAQSEETAEQHPGTGEYVESFKYFKLD